MNEAERQDLAKSMLRNVLAAAQGMRVAIVAPPEANDVRRFALINGARFLPETGEAGLDFAAADGISQLAELGYDRVIVVHSDLPLVRDLTWLAETDGVIIVPDRSGQGTNAISVPASAGFRFAFGPGSCERHQAESRRLGFEPEVVVDLDGISADVDEPEDISRLGGLLDRMFHDEVVEQVEA